MSGHARVAPSSLHRVRKCPASLVMQEAYPHLPWDDEDASRDGTCAHWALQTVLTSGVWPAVGDRDPSGTAVTDEMLQGVELAVEWVQRRMAELGVPPDALMVEVAVSIGRVHASCWGTPDIRFWAPGKVLIVADFKFGFRYVSEFENDQLMAYTVGAIEAAGLSDLEVRVENVIIQPRAYGRSPVRTWAYNAADIRAHVNQLAMASTEALSPNPRARATPDGCRNCRAQHACPTLQNAAQWAMDYADRPTPMELPPDALSVELRFAERQAALLKARIDGLTAQATHAIRNGQRLPHHTVQAGRSSSVWKLPEDQIVALGRSLSLDLAKPLAAITPGQAVKLGLPKQLLDGLAETKPGSMSLVEDDGSAARKVFAKSS